MNTPRILIVLAKFSRRTKSFNEVAAREEIEMIHYEGNVRVSHKK
jgi:hypothetical protein